MMYLLLFQNQLLIKWEDTMKIFFCNRKKSIGSLGLKKGFKIFYTPKAKLWHKVAMTTGGKDSNIRHFHSEKVV